MQTQQTQTLVLLLPNVVTSLTSDFLTPFLCPSFSYDFQYFHSILLCCFLLFIPVYQIVTALLSYALRVIYNPGTTHIHDTSVGSRLPLVVSLAAFFQGCGSTVSF